MSIPSGKGIWIWQINQTEGGDAAAIAKLLAENGFTYAVIKIIERQRAFNALTARPLCEALDRAGIMPVGWGYHYPDSDPVIVGNLVVNQVSSLGLHAYYFDAETEFCENPNQQWVIDVMRRVRYNLSNIPHECSLGLSSFRFPITAQPEFPWEAWLKGGIDSYGSAVEGVDIVAPQVYWMEATNAGDQLARSYSQYQRVARSLGARMPAFIPTGIIVKEDSGSWRPTADQERDFMDSAWKMGLKTFDFWDLQECRADPLMADVWQAVCQWQPAAPPPPTQRAGTGIVIWNDTHVRSTPAVDVTEKNVLGHLPAGLPVAIRSVVAVGEDQWALLDTATPMYVAVKVNGKVFLNVG